MPQLFSHCRNGSLGFLARHLLLAGFVLFPLTAGAAGLGHIRVRSALGERFEAVVSVSSVDEALSSACFQLVDSSAGDGLKALRRAQLEFRRSGQGGEVRIRGLEHESEPVLRLALRLRCPEGATSGIVREYSVLLDPPEYGKAARPSPVAPVISPSTMAPRPAVKAASVWLVRSGDTLERLARRHFPRDPGSREQFISQLRELNTDLPQDAHASLSEGLFLALPPVSKTALKGPRPDARAAKTKAPATLSQTAPRAGGQETPKNTPYRLQIASAPQTMASKVSNLSEADKLKQREQMLQQETDDQTAQLLQLKNRIAQLEKQIAEMSQAASAASSVAATPVPVVKVSSLAPSPEPESGVIVYWLLAAGGAVLASIAGVLAWRRYQGRKETSPAVEEAFSFEPEVAAWSASGADAVSIKPVSSAISSFTDEKTAPQEVPSAASGSGAEEWGNSAEINVVQPETVAEEISLLMEHGMVHEAIEILTQEIKHRPQAVVLWMKLFEAYALLGDRRQFAEYAEAFHGRFLSEAWWEQVQAIGRQLDPENPLYGLDEASGGAPSLASQLDQTPLAPPELRPDVKEAVPAQPEVMLEFSLELPLPEVSDSLSREADSAGQSFSPLFGSAEPALDLPPLDLPVSGALSETDFVSDDPTMQAISRLAMAGQRDEACHQLEELLYRGSFEQQLLAAKWLDKLLQIK